MSAAILVPVTAPSYWRTLPSGRVMATMGYPFETRILAKGPGNLRRGALKSRNAGLFRGQDLVIDRQGLGTHIRFVEQVAGAADGGIRQRDAGILVEG